MVIKIKEKLKQKEGLNIEFKESKISLNKDVCETVCSFLNRAGGEIFLGVADDGKIIGIDENKIEQIKKDFTTAINNKNKITPSVYLSIEEVNIDDKKILYIYVPEGSYIYKCGNKIYDRNNDSDIDITDRYELVKEMYLRKSYTYTENKVFQYLKIEDLRSDLIEKARKLAYLRVPDHPWKYMTNEELLKSAGLYEKDYNNNVEGYTLACALLFGKDEVIHSVCPHYKTDALLRKVDVDRYDDRDDIRTNLIESYERLMAFVKKHLNDNFYLEGDVSISIRDKIFREIICNMLIHREFTNPCPARFIIEKTRVYTENSNRPRYNGIITPSNATPYPKNPSIAKVFKEIGFADELGSGMRNTYKYSKIYSGNDPVFLDEDMFKTIISFDKFDETEKKQEEKDLNKTEIEILKLINDNENITQNNIANEIGLTIRTVRRNIDTLKKKGIITRIGSDRKGYFKTNKII